MSGKRIEYSDGSLSRWFGLLFVSRIVIIVVVGAIIAAAILGLMLERNLAVEYALAIRHLHIAEESLIATLVYSAAFQGVFAVPAIAVALVFLSHRVVGPIFRATVVLREVAEGKIVSETRLRKNDQLSPLIDSLNKMKSEMRLFSLCCHERLGRIESLTREYETIDLKSRADMLKELREEIDSFAEFAGRASFKE